MFNRYNNRKNKIINGNNKNLMDEYDKLINYIQIYLSVASK